MQKRDDSLRSLGITRIAVDKPLRRAIRERADCHGLTMVDYLRFMVEADQVNKPQLAAIKSSAPVTREDIQSIKRDLVGMVRAMVWVPAVALGIIPVPDSYWRGEEKISPEAMYSKVNEAIQDKLAVKGLSPEAVTKQLSLIKGMVELEA